MVPADDTTAPRKRLLVAALLGIHALLLAWGALRNSPSVDEPMHLAAGIYHWHTGRFDLDRGNPPLTGLVSALPVLAAAPQTNWGRVPATFPVAVDFLKANGLRTCWLVTLGSWACISFSLLGGYICYRWATELYGDAAGMTALVIWCFSPNTIAYGQMITGDMPATATGVTAAYFFWQWLRRPDYWSAILAGLTLGLAELAKYVWVLLYALWPLIWIGWYLTTRRQLARPRLRSQSAQMASMILACLYVVNLGYAFDGTGSRLKDYYIGRSLLAWCSEEEPDSSSDQITLGSLPVPLPKDYVGGIDEIAQLRKRPPVCYLRRVWRDGGFWQYYPYAVLIKLPVGLLALALVAGFLTCFAWRKEIDWRSELLLLALPAAVLVFVTMSKTPQTYRYVLPYLPFAIIWISKIGRVLTTRRRSHVLVVSALLLSTIQSGLNTYPHSLSYFNELVGGPARGHAHLILADADFGQDFLFLRRWISQHPEASPLGMTWRHPLIDPRFLEIDYIDVPGGLVHWRTHSLAERYSLGPQPGWYAVNVNALRERAGGYAYFHCFEPVGHAGYSISIYHITTKEANRVRSDLGLPKLLAETGL